MKKYFSPKLMVSKEKTNRLKTFLVFLFLILGVFQVDAANKEAIYQQSVSGIVVSMDNTLLPGVSVVIVGTNVGTQTDFDGKYTINAKKGDQLQFSFLGMKTKKITVGSSNIINVTLEEEVNSLDEIVVIGYGSQNKREVTGAISSVKADNLTKIPTINAVEALQGRVPGLTIINNGSPGSVPTVRIRGIGTLGDNNPVYVVDDVVVTDINNLSTNDIESISVLKDASTTAIYGSLGANGVIVIKTKSGKKGKVVFKFNTYLRTQFKPKSLTLLNTEQYLSYVSDMLLNDTDPLTTIPVNFSDTNLTNNNVDYQDAIFQSGIAKNYEISASGGGEYMNFRLSSGYLSQSGILLNTNIDRYTFRVNSKFEKGKITIGESLGINYTKQNPLIESFSLSSIENAVRMAPYLPILNPNSIGGYSELHKEDDMNSARNPVRTLNRETQLNRSISVLGNIFAKINILDDLEYKVNVGLNFYDNNYKRSELPYGIENDFHNQLVTRFTHIDFRESTFTLQNSLRYKKTINESHNIELLALSELQNRDTNVLIGGGTTDLGITNITSGITGGANSAEYNKIGYLGRLNYTYANKYNFAASIRRDGSSRFGVNNKWGNFPSLAAGWLVSEENFFNTDGFLNYLKLRGSWGLTGNDKSAGDYAFESLLLANFFYGTDAALAISSLPNPNLKWEETEITNIGIDLGFFNNNITLSAEYYSNKSNDLIIDVPPAASVGVLNATPINIGGMTTKGFEFDLGIKGGQNDFKWSANLNLSTTSNEVTQLAENVQQLFNGAKPEVLANRPISRISVGESLWHFYGHQTDGIFQNQAEIDAAATQANAAPGDIRFKDTNLDGVINADDSVVLGDPFPDITYGLSLDTRYKNFDATFLFTGVYGNEIFNATRYYLDGSAQISNAGTAVLDRWTVTNPSATQPRAVVNDPNENSRVSNRYVEDGSYFRFKNVSIGYNFPKSKLKSMMGGSLSELRIYGSAQNLFTITNYSGFDPEIGPSLGIASSGGDENSELGVDRGQYPQSKSFVFGLQVTF